MGNFTERSFDIHAIQCLKIHNLWYLRKATRIKRYRKMMRKLKWYHCRSGKMTRLGQSRFQKHIFFPLRFPSRQTVFFSSSPMLLWCWAVDHDHEMFISMSCWIKTLQILLYYYIFWALFIQWVPAIVLTVISSFGVGLTDRPKSYHGSPYENTWSICFSFPSHTHFNFVAQVTTSCRKFL